MDDRTLESLEQALLANPGSPHLLQVLLSARLERNQPELAARLIEGADPSLLPEPLQQLAARVHLARGAPRDALAGLLGDAPDSFLLRARALLALERHAEGREAYEAAVGRNPTLEDVDLRASLFSRVRVVEPAPEGGSPRLRVIANDDTDAEDAARALIPEQTPVTFQDVGGLEAIKRQIHKRIVLPFQKPSLFERFRKKVGGGILMYGPPGCGKTLLARATAGECQAQFLNVAISDVLDMYIGESERKLHALFENARQHAPAILFFDELEALAGKRQYSREASSSKLVSQFLSEMDGFSQANKGVLILGATNVPWAVDPAFRRPGRFDRVLFVPPPDQPARLSILELLLRGRPCEPELRLDAVARKTSGFTGADLQNLAETAADAAIERSLEDNQERPIAARDLEAALAEVKPTALEWLTTARNYARYANESGQYDDVLAFLRQHGKE